MWGITYKKHGKQRVDCASLNFSTNSGLIQILVFPFCFPILFFVSSFKSGWTFTLKKNMLEIANHAFFFLAGSISNTLPPFCHQDITSIMTIETPNNYMSFYCGENVKRLLLLLTIIMFEYFLIHYIFMTIAYMYLFK